MGNTTEQLEVIQLLILGEYRFCPVSGLRRECVVHFGARKEDWLCVKSEKIKANRVNVYDLLFTF